MTRRGFFVSLRKVTSIAYNPNMTEKKTLTVAKSMTKPMTKLMFVDDESSQRELVAGYFAKRGYEVSQAGSGVEALKAFESFRAPVVCVDMKMPGMNGIELIGKLLEIEATTQIIVLTAFGTVETAVVAMRAWAFHYQTKPVDLQELTINIEKALAQYRLLREAGRTQQALKETLGSSEILGSSPAIQKVRELIDVAGPSESSVLITGPSGSGKELIAQAIHRHSSRAEGRFVAVNCAAFPEALLESELFGHEKGAFTGAERKKIGRFELADGGSLFLDEIGEAPMTLQVKLLRALETREIEPLGSENSVAVDFRLIAATNKDLEKTVSDGNFREDLFYRLNVIRVAAPALVDRGADIIELAQVFLTRFALRSVRGDLKFSEEALVALQAYSWPGNVRELQNMIERAVILTAGDVIGAEAFAGLSHASRPELTQPERPLTLAAMEERHIRRTLDENKWSIGVTAEALGIHRNTLTQKIKDYQLKRDS